MVTSIVLSGDGSGTLIYQDIHKEGSHSRDHQEGGQHFCQADEPVEEEGRDTMLGARALYETDIHPDEEYGSVVDALIQGPISLKKSQQQE